MTSTVPPVPPPLPPVTSYSLMTSSLTGAAPRCINGANSVKLHHQMALYGKKAETDLAVLLERSVRILPDPERNIAYNVWYHQDIVPQLQVGPMCGLVALSIASKVDVLTLLSEAKSMKVTSFGEMFSAEWMCQLVNQSQSLNISFKARVETVQENLTWRKLKEHFTQRRFVLVAYDLGEDMKIGFRNGHKAHWVLLVGFMYARKYPEVNFDSNDCFEGDNLKFFHEGPGDMELESAEGLKFVLGFHGKSRRMCVYNLEKLVQSNQQLFEPGSFVDESFVVPSEGLERHLCGKIVVLERN